MFHKYREKKPVLHLTTDYFLCEGTDMLINLALPVL